MWCEGLSHEKWEEKHDYDEDIMQYLHGRCNVWVNEHYQHNDKCVAILEYRDESEKLCLMHSCLLRNNKYVDVRGETENIDDVLEAFDWGEYEIETYNSIKDFNTRMKQLGVQ